MSDTYTKLFSSITASTIVSEPPATRWAWVTMLAAVKPDGCVYGSIPGLARLANLSIAEIETALTCFLGPDPYSRTQDNEGRRIEAIDGGWLLLNHAKYDAIRNEAERADYKRQWDRDHRPSGHARQFDSSPTVRQWDRDHRPSGHARQSDSSPTVRQQSDSSPTKPDSPTPSASTSTSVKQEQRKKHARATRSPLVPMPPEFGISDAVRRWAEAKGYDRLREHLENFRDTATARAYVYADWDAALRKAIDCDWAELRGRRNGNCTRSGKLSVVDQVEAAIADRDRKREREPIQGEIIRTSAG